MVVVQVLTVRKMRTARESGWRVNGRTQDAVCPDCLESEEDDDE